MCSKIGEFEWYRAISREGFWEPTHCYSWYIFCWLLLCLLNLLARYRRKTLLNRLWILSKTQTKLFLVSRIVHLATSNTPLHSHLAFVSRWELSHEKLTRSQVKVGVGTWRKVLYFLENHWRNGTERITIHALVRLAWFILDTHTTLWQPCRIVTSHNSLLINVCVHRTEHQNSSNVTIKHNVHDLRTQGVWSRGPIQHKANT